MEIRVAHQFPCSPRAYWDLTRDPEFEDDVRREAEVDITVLERREEGATLTEKVRVSPQKELPAIAQKALGTPRLAYLQESVANSDTFTTAWKVTPEVLSGKVTCGGTARVVDAPGGCERVIEGEIRVALPLVGGTIEKHVLDLMTRSYDRAAEVARRHLARRT